MDFCDGATDWSQYFVVHFHGFQEAKQVSSFNFLTFFHVQIDDRSRYVRDNGSRLGVFPLFPMNEFLCELGFILQAVDF